MNPAHNLKGDDAPLRGTTAMKPITIICDRCKKEIQGYIEEGVATSKFYDVSPGAWDEFAYPGEKYVCDECMHRDPRYHKAYFGV